MSVGIASWLALTLPARAEDAASAIPPQGVAWIMVADADGSNLRRVAHRQDEFQSQGSPCWSPDGKQIAFDVWSPQKGQDNTNAKIVVANADGTNARVLIDGCMPSFSPAGKRIAFSRYAPNHGVWLMNTEGTEEGLVLIDAQGWAIDWSPDGTQLAYVSRSRNGADFTILDLVEGTYREVFADKKAPLPYRSIEHNFCWSPDSRKLIFKGTKPEMRDEIGMVDVRGPNLDLTTRVHYTGGRNRLSWRPGTNQVLISIKDKDGDPLQMYVFDPTRPDQPVRLGKQNPDLSYSDPAYSGDGEKIVVSIRQRAKPQAAD